MNKLHPGTRWIFRFRIYLALLPLLIFLIIISTFASYFTKTLIFLYFWILFAIIFAEIFARMSYNRYFYEVNNKGIKIEKGIIWKKYTSIPFERVQNVDTKRGIFARIFGFSTIDIETAGQSNPHGPYMGMRIRIGNRNYQRYESEGHIPGIPIDEAEKIRDFILKKITKKIKKLPKN